MGTRPTKINKNTKPHAYTEHITEFLEVQRVRKRRSREKKSAKKVSQQEMLWKTTDFFLYVDVDRWLFFFASLLSCSLHFFL